MAFAGSEAPQKRRKSFSTFSSLHNTDYCYLWIGNLFNSAGLWIQQVTVSWLVWELSRSAAMCRHFLNTCSRCRLRCIGVGVDGSAHGECETDSRSAKIVDMCHSILLKDIQLLNIFLLLMLALTTRALSLGRCMRLPA